MDSSAVNNALPAGRKDRGRQPAKRSRPDLRVDYIRQQVIAAVGWDRAINEGYRIHTTIDVNLQRAPRIL
jgi:Membrane carboxypeptidase/penicillin-binding protein